MTRLHRHLFGLNDRIARLLEEERLAAEELRFHEHLDDDARRDAATGSPLDREDARDTAADVARFRALVDDLGRRRRRLEAKRGRLLRRLG